MLWLLPKLLFFSLLCFLWLTGSAAAEESVINPGDTISILVWGHDQYTQTMAVRPGGKISYPFLGEVKVDGLTTAELSEKIREALLKHLIDPQVTVAITQPKKNEVFVLGQVGFPNQLRFDQDRLSLLKALSMAGGVLNDTADPHNVKIIRDDGTSEIVDLEGLLTSEPQQSVFLYPGDLVYVPEQERITVSGYVLKPGEYRIRSSLSVTQALALAGGPLQDTADLSKALLIRSSGEVVSVEFNSNFWADGSQDEIYKLDPGDTLYVPSAYQVEEVNILGYVRNPGRFKVKRPITLFEALALAGGIIDMSKVDLRRARVIREKGKVEQVDLSTLKEAIPKDFSTIRSFVLYPGDTFEVPKKRRLIKWSWPLALTIVSVISIVYNMVN